MSTQVDNRVVQMKFNNKEFEKGVSQTQQSIGDLNNSLNNLGKDAEKQNFIQRAFNSISDSIDETSKKFNAIEEIGIGAFRRIGEQITDTATSMIKSISIDQAAAGWTKYESLVSNTAGLKNIAAYQNYDYDMVSEKLKQLQWYADSTSYDMDAMTTALLSMANAGIDLKKATKVVMGLGNSFSYAGATATEMKGAFYMFSKALGDGMNLGAAAYKSLESIYKVITPELKDLWMEEAVHIGTLTKVQDKYFVTTNKKIEVTKENLSTTLNEKWLNGDVLSKVYSKTFGDYAKGVYNVTKQYKKEHGVLLTVTEAMDEYDRQHIEAGKAVDEFGRKVFESAMEAKTFSEVIDATKDAASSAFSNIYQSIFGDYEKAKKTFTDLGEWAYDAFVQPIVGVSDMITDWSKKTTNVINEATGKRLTGRTALMRSIGEFDKYVKSILYPLKEGFQDVFPMADYQKLLDLTEKLYNWVHKLSITDEQAKNLKTMSSAVAYGLRDIINLGKILIGMTKKVFEVVKPLGPYVTKFINGLASGSVYIHETISDLNIVTRLVDDFGKKLSGAKAKVKGWTQEWKISGEVTKALLSVFSPEEFDFSSITDELYSVTDWFKTGFSNGIKGAGALFAAAFAGMKASVTEFYNEFMTKIKETYGTFDGFVEAVKAKLFELKSFLKKTILDIKKFFSDIFGTTQKGTEEFEQTGFFNGKLGNRKSLYQLYYEEMMKAPTAFEQFIDMMKQILGVVKSIFSIELIRTFSQFMKSWKKVGKAIADGLNEITISTKKPSKLLNIGKTFLMIALAIGLIAMIPDEELQRAMGAFKDLAKVVVLMTVLSGMVGASDFNGRAMMQYFKGFGRAMVLMATTLKILSGIDNLDQVMPVFRQLGAILVLFALFASQFDQRQIVPKKATTVGGDFDKIGTMLYKFAGAMLILAEVMKILGNIENPQQALDMLGVITAILIAVVGAMVIFDETADTKGLKGASKMGPVFLSVAGAILAIALALALLSILPTEKLWSAVGALGVIVMVMTMLVASLGEVSGQGNDLLKAAGAMVIISLAMTIMAAALIAIGLIPMVLLAKGLITILALLWTLKGLAIAMQKGADMGKLALALVALGAGMFLFAAACSKFAQMDFGAFAKSFVGMILFLGALFAFAKIMAMMPTVNMSLKTFALVAVGFGAGLMLIAMAVERFSKMDPLTVANALISMIAGAVIAITASSELIIEGIEKLFFIILDAVIGILLGTFERIKNFFHETGPKLMDAIKEALGLQAEASFGELVVTLAKKLGNWLKEKAWPWIKEKFGQLGRWILDAIKGVFNNWKERRALRKAGKQAADDINGGFKDEEEIASPSKVWMKYGSYMMAGMAKGLKESTNKPVRQAEKSAKLINTAMSSIGDGLTDDMNNQLTITPVLDLSNIQNESLSGLLKDPVINPKLAYQPVGDYDRMMQFTSGIDSLSTKLGDLLSRDDADIGAAVREALSGMGIYMNGRTVGKMLNGYQSNLAKARG